MRTYIVNSPINAYADSPRDKWVLINKLRKYYTGTIAIYRVMDPDLISGIMGVYFTKFPPDDFFELQDDNNTVINELNDIRIYVIKDLVKNTVNFYISGSIYQHEVTLQGKPTSMASNWPINQTLLTLSTDCPEVIRLTEGRMHGGLTIILDYVFDYWCKGVFTKDMLAEYVPGSLSRKVYINYSERPSVVGKEFLAFDAEERIP